MNDQPARDRDTRRRARITPGSLFARRATVVGLGGIGRQVALQLAALGVARLQLVDAGSVSRRTHAAEGYAEDDIGRPKVHATAQLCHQINPKLDIHTLQSRSLRGLDLGDAVFCCTLSTRRRRSIWQAVGHRVRFYTGVDVADDRIYLPVVVNAAAAEDEPGGVELLPPWGETAGRQRPACPVQIASILAGLMVAEFVRFAAGQGTSREIHLNLRDLSLIVTGLA
jgi:sulfur carrier protein ThiS adenylyltransferase